MRVALDATYAFDPEPSGVARYSRRIIAALDVLSSQAGEDLEITLAARPRRYAALRREYPSKRFRRSFLQEPLNLLLPWRVDLFHGLNQRLPHYRFRRQVVTVHDVFPLSSDRYSTPDFRRRFSEQIRDAVRRADALIAVSAYTRQELCRRLEVDPARVTVVHHGIDTPKEVPSEALAQARVWSPFLLTVGAVQVRKNTLGAVQAMEQLPKNLRLVVAGGMGHGAQQVLDYVREKGLNERVLFLGHTGEATLDALYAEAAALVFPSFEEGFGFPVLEAMARGLPVVAARAGAIPEIAGDAALLVDPQDVEALAQACRRVLEDQALAGDLRVRGRNHARQFGWARAAQQTLRVYNNLLDD